MTQTAAPVGNAQLDTPDATAQQPLATGWRYAAEAAAYRRSVEAILAEQSVANRLQSRPEVTANAVRGAMAAPAAIMRTLELSRETLASTRDSLDERTKTRRKLARAEAEAGLEPASLATLLYLGVLLFGQDLVGAPSIVEQVIFALVGVVVVGWLLFRPRARRHLRSFAVLGPYMLELWLDRDKAADALKKLEAEFTTHSARQVLLEVIVALLGEDPHSVLAYDSYQGLRARGDSEFLVPTACGGQLARKLSLIDGGTIALSGPRGAGKTTLLRAAPGLLRTSTPGNGDGPDFVVEVAVPAAYTPYDFVLSCLVGVCEQFLKRNGQAVPDFTRLSGFVRLHRRMDELVRRSARRLLFAILAAALLVLGISAAARGWWGGHRLGVQSWGLGAVREAVRGITLVWQGQYIVACLAIVFASVVLWRLRTPGRLRRFLGVGPQDRIGQGLLWVFGWCLVAIPAVDVLRDFLLASGIRPWDEVTKAITDLLVPFGVAMAMLLFVFVGLQLPSRPRRLTRQDRMLIAFAVAVMTSLGTFNAFPIGHAYISDPENPARLGLFVLGIEVVAASGKWRRSRPVQSPLARRCLDKLYQLRTAQSTSASFNLAPAPIFGTAHGSSLSSVPLAFPQLVATLRELLEAIAEDLRKSSHGRVFLCIDELDRMGTTDKAREFLSEVKALLGVPHVYYLVTVAEDVSAAFVRRGLPHRDATDSSFDDVVHVRPLALAESMAVLEQRVPRLPYPYVVLSHALSGGIPRDLIRYALRLVELRQSTPYVELRDIAHLILTEELSDTLAGFRTLLASQPWTANTAHVLTGYRTLTETLDVSCPHRREALVHALLAFAWPTAPAHGAQGSASGNEEGLQEATRQLIAEARAYTVYGLTLLQIFTPPNFDQRSAETAARVLDGVSQRLADMRLELAISPFSARELIDRVRRAWDLADATAASPSFDPASCAVPPCAPEPESV
ncbi:P-loop NTPase fold protein [Streptomyces sp. NPDC059718]